MGTLMGGAGTSHRDTVRVSRVRVSGKSPRAPSLTDRTGSQSFPVRWSTSAEGCERASSCQTAATPFGTACTPLEASTHKRRCVFVDATQQIIAAASGDGSQDRRTKRKRTTASQLGVLVASFAQSDAPSYEVREELAAVSVGLMCEDEDDRTSRLPTPDAAVRHDESRGPGRIFPRKCGLPGGHSALTIVVIYRSGSRIAEQKFHASDREPPEPKVPGPGRRLRIMKRWRRPDQARPHRAGGALKRASLASPRLSSRTRMRWPVRRRNRVVSWRRLLARRPARRTGPYTGDRSRNLCGPPLPPP